ncbi:MAG: glycosyltransferase family 4 protein, partial [Bacteroidia bacterium]
KSSIPEVAGDAALIVNEITADNFAKAIMKLQDLSFRDKVIKRGVIQAKKFSWDKCFNEVKQFYKDIYKG